MGGTNLRCDDIAFYCSGCLWEEILIASLKATYDYMMLNVPYSTYTYDDGEEEKSFDNDYIKSTNEIFIYENGVIGSTALQNGRRIFPYKKIFTKNLEKRRGLDFLNEYNTGGIVSFVNNECFSVGNCVDICMLLDFLKDHFEDGPIKETIYNDPVPTVFDRRKYVSLYKILEEGCKTRKSLRIED